MVVRFAEQHRTLAGVVANTALLIKIEGSTECHRKMHLPRLAKSYFKPGADLTRSTRPPPGRCPGVCGQLIPAAARVLALRAAEVIAVSYQAPTLPNPTFYHGTTATRAYEDRYHVAANRCREQGDVAFCGTSAIGAPDGTLPADLGDRPGTARA